MGKDKRVFVEARILRYHNVDVIITPSDTGDTEYVRFTLGKVFDLECHKSNHEKAVAEVKEKIDILLKTIEHKRVEV